MTIRTQTLYWHANADDDKPRPTQLCLLRGVRRGNRRYVGAEQPSLAMSLYRWRPGDGYSGCWVEQVDGEFTLPDDVVVEWAYAEE